MENGKIENLLNLALSSTSEERKKSDELNVGYNEIFNTWELIVKHNGRIRELESEAVQIVELSFNYAIVTIDQNEIEEFSKNEIIEYIEKPKRLEFAVTNGIRASCINPLTVGKNGLTGEGVIIGIIDSGIDYRHEVFRNLDGTTKIMELWDQSRAGNPPEGFYIGSVYDADEINASLESGNILMLDTSGHGTHVAGIASAIAPKADLIIVKLRNSLINSFPKTTELMQAIDYVVKQAFKRNMPLVLNLSFGNSYGSHDGTSLIETFIDEIGSYGRTCIVVGTGNEGSSGGHTSGILSINTESVIEVKVDNYETALSIQLWKSYSDDIEIRIANRVIDSRSRVSRYLIDNTELLVYWGEPTPYSKSQEVFFDFIPRNNYIDSGIWKISLTPKSIVDGRYDMWLPGTSSFIGGSTFLSPSPDTTLTIPSTALGVISVGAYDALTDSYAFFSGRGYTRATNQIKPDIIAPGVNVYSAAPGGGYTYKSGTSMAAPFVSGSAALLMEWGIIRGNDVYLYGEKVKAYLIKGARQLPGMGSPNQMTGWGALCLGDSLPV